MLRRQKAFTLIELMVVVSIIALLAAMLLPALQRALEQTRRGSCQNNLKGAGAALAIYSQNFEAYPMIPGKGWDSVADSGGTPGTTNLSTNTPFPTASPNGDWNVNRSVTSLMFMLIRNGESPKLFLCPSDNAKQDVWVNNTGDSGNFNWDFSCWDAAKATVRNCSYSYQCPIYSGSAGAPALNGVPSSPDSALVVMADRTPVNSGGTGGSANTPAVFGGAAGSPGNWATGIAGDKIHYFNSQNHTSGEMMNVLYIDGHAVPVRNPNCGTTVTATGTSDCIYAAITTAVATAPDDGIDYGGTADFTKHTGKKDTYLWGSSGK